MKVSRGVQGGTTPILGMSLRSTFSSFHSLTPCIFNHLRLTVPQKTMKMIFFILTLLLALGFALIPSSYGKEGGLVGYWKFDNKANLGEDSSDFGNHGEAKGNAKGSKDGSFGGVLELDGKSQIEVPDSDSLSIKGDKVSLVVWVNFTEIGDFYQAIISKDGSNGDLFADYHLSVCRSGYLGGAFFFDGMTTKGRATAPICATKEAPQPKAWYHVAGVYDGKEQRMYINGKFGESAGGGGDNPVAQSGDLLQTGNPLRIGHNTIHNWFTRAFIDEAAVFNRALSEGEVKKVMEGGVFALLAVQPKGKLSTVWGQIKSGE